MFGDNCLIKNVPPSIVRVPSPTYTQELLPLKVPSLIGFVIVTASKLRENDAFTLLGAIGGLLSVLFYVVLYNRMMVYVEKHAYDSARDNGTEKTPDNTTYSK